MKKKKGKGKGKNSRKVAAINKKGDIKPNEEATSSGIGNNKEEICCDGGHSMTSEVQHRGETTYFEQSLHENKSDMKQIEGAASIGIGKNKEEAFSDGGQSMAGEVEHRRETSHFEERKPKFTYGAYENNVQHGKGAIMGLKAINVQTIDCAISDVFDCMPNMLGVQALKVYLGDGCSMVLKKIKLDFKEWYSFKCKDFKVESDDWLKHIDPKESFSGIVKLFAKLSPNFPKGDKMGVIRVLYEGDLYNMKYDGNEGYVRDIKRLLKMIENVLMGLPPDSCDEWEMQKPLKGSKEFKNFVSDLKDFNPNSQDVPFYPPYFWSCEERLEFMDKVYDLFWVEKNIIRDDVEVYVYDTLNQCFPSDWQWWDQVPAEGPLRKVYEYIDGKKEAQSQGKKVQSRYKVQVDSIVFWRNCRFHYNDHVEDKSERKSVEEIETELSEKFDICGQAFTAICNLLECSSWQSPSVKNWFLS